MDSPGVLLTRRVRWRQAAASGTRPARAGRRRDDGGYRCGRARRRERAHLGLHAGGGARVPSPERRHHRSECSGPALLADRRPLDGPGVHPQHQRGYRHERRVARDGERRGAPGAHGRTGRGRPGAVPHPLPASAEPPAGGGLCAGAQLQPLDGRHLGDGKGTAPLARYRAGLPARSGHRGGPLRQGARGMRRVPARGRCRAEPHRPVLLPSVRGGKQAGHADLHPRVGRQLRDVGPAGERPAVQTPAHQRVP